ncbi:MAG: SGNH/GDSL hydrolase family protein [Lutimonas sp.]
MILKWLLILFSTLLLHSVEDASTTTAPAESFYTRVSCKGRHEVLQDKSVALIGSAASVEFEVRSDSVILYLQSEFKHGNSFVITINDLYQGRFLLNDDKVQDIRIGLSKDQMSRIGIFKATEAATGNLIVRAIESEAPLKKVPNRSKTIEFIGNSITCGAAADTQTIPCGTAYYHDQHNAYLAYGPRIARALNVDYFLSSVSGIGIYRNWNDDHDKEPIMPEVYENLYLNKSDVKPYSFDVTPDLVSICLGTNDLSSGDGVKERLAFNRAAFVSNYVAFVKTVRGHYSDAQILLLSSSIVHGENHKVLVECLNEIKKALEPEIEVHVFDLKPFMASGCTGHPSINDHQRIAETLIPTFESLLENPKAE